MLTEEKYLDDVAESLYQDGRILSKFNNQKSWKLRAVRFWLQCSNYKVAKRFELAINNYSFPRDLEEKIRNRLISIRDFQKATEPKILGVKIDWKFKLVMLTGRQSGSGSRVDESLSKL
jgi:hypothetical protein